MNKQLATGIFESLASGVRLDIYRLLVKTGPQGLVAGEIGSALEVPPTNLSFHLKALTHAQLVAVVQEGRYQRYRANLGLMQELIAYLTAVLFLCTHNSARSILAEAMLNHIGRAASRPFRLAAARVTTSGPTRWVCRYCNTRASPIEGLHSKSWDEFGKPDAPHMDLVITVCDNAAGEVCPYWPGQPCHGALGLPRPV
jgi:protein-tyrosine-phosphatase